ncbi:MAG: class I SAM-dependent methyltransferase [Acidobacteriota bacterium]
MAARTRLSFWDLAYRDGEHERIWEDPRPQRWIAELIATERLEGALGLDVGCGGGRDALAAARHGVHMLGVDRSAWGLTIARRRAHCAGIAARFCRGDALSLPVRNATVDLLIDRGCFHVFLETATRRRAAAEATRVVGPDGLMVLEGARRDDEEAGLGRIDAEIAERFFAPGFALERLERTILRAPAGDLPAHRLFLRRLT